MADFGIGAFGPTLRLVLLDQAGAQWLHDVFDSMAGAEHPLALHDRSEVSFKQHMSLELVRTDIQQPVRLTLSDATMRWICTADEWITNAMLLLPFGEGRRGHQYLTREGKDDVLVEVSFGEG